MTAADRFRDNYHERIHARRIRQQRRRERAWYRRRCAKEERALERAAKLLPLPRRLPILRDGARPTVARTGVRHLECRLYDDCLDYVDAMNWPRFHCGACPVMTTEAKATNLPDDREGKRVKFTILVSEPQRDGTTTHREVEGYLTMNTKPDGKSLREVWLVIGKSGGSDAMYDEWARQANGRLRDGASVDKVFRTHVGTRFDGGGFLKRPIDDIRQCSSVLDLVSRIVIGRFSREAK